MIEELEVMCENEEICNWKGKYVNLNTHLKNCLGEKQKKKHLQNELSSKPTIILILDDDFKATKSKETQIIDVSDESDDISLAGSLDGEEKATMTIVIEI